MTDAVASQMDGETARYEIRLQGTAPGPLREMFPTATVITTPAETVLVRQFEEPAELDDLIGLLLAMGLVLTEVHELLMPAEASVVGREPSTCGEEHRRAHKL